ncbi:MAG: hypothetical protein ABEJ69_00155 [Candidatus Nanohaloarchaea archaeon]
MGIKLWMVFEALSPSRDGLEETLNDHVEKLRSENGVDILSVEEDEVTEMEDPHPELEKGYSKVVEVDIEVETLSKAVNLTLNYGPTYIQVEGPENIEVDLKDAQDALQKMATTMHQYAQQGPGGVLISKASQE